VFVFFFAKCNATAFGRFLANVHVRYMSSSVRQSVCLSVCTAVLSLSEVNFNVDDLLFNCLFFSFVFHSTCTMSLSKVDVRYLIC